MSRSYGIAHISDSLFHRSVLAAPLADVSFGGTAVFRHAALSNVLLRSGRTVGTARNDKQGPDKFNACTYDSLQLVCTVP